MEKSGLWTKQKTADYLFADMVDNPKKRLIKLNNWIARKIIPRKVMDKMGKEIVFFEDSVKEWLEERKRKVA
ncbi:TPA: hypothetical protein CPT98_07205 [Candidatus Gastranaerophilales bacterium HUM_19]|jgi:hypothetical protein|nr:MAG TPA: hypothetical protein CPT98_07205 [Candidatus Gastranaerophilales bacterium HUM_19]DAB19537.1 MAG TPA: hypothetical protein CPT97_02110 [Candidatus Gastranaerophilales bacterium HUM_17]DAB26127.1 MAG TPA: hypothetical protein CPT86_03830 [Candidatus Gastranaerophilales bacterium HUM_23]